MLSSWVNVLFLLTIDEFVEVLVKEYSQEYFHWNTNLNYSLFIDKSECQSVRLARSSVDLPEDILHVSFTSIYYIFIGENFYV